MCKLIIIITKNTAVLIYFVARYGILNDLFVGRKKRYHHNTVIHKNNSP